MERKRILLIMAPPFWPKMPPLGIGYLQSFLLQKSIDTQILDLNNIFYNYAREKLKEDWLISCNTYLEGSIYEIIRNEYPHEFQNYIDKMVDFDYVGFSCFKSNYNTVVKIASLLRAKRNDIKIIFGGPEITRQYLKSGGLFDPALISLANFLVVGEGELSLFEYINDNCKDNVSVFNQLFSLDRFDFPRYEGIDLAAYPKKYSLPIIISRGCVRKCNFCSERLIFKGFRSRAVTDVIAEIDYNRKNNETENFIFFDSLINADMKKLDDLCDSIIKCFGMINWEAQIAIHPQMSVNTLRKMKESGCYNLFIGLESGSDSVLKRMNKGFKARDALAFFQKLKDSGISFGISIIIGYPGETEQEFQESLDFIICHKDIIPKIEQVNPFTYYEGTNTDASADYKLNKDSLRRMDIFVREIKRNNFKYTNAFLGNLIDK